MDDQTDKRLKSASGWFLFIGICTLVNVAMVIFHVNMRLVLGATFVDVAVFLFNRLLNAAPESKAFADFFIGMGGAFIFIGLAKHALAGKHWAYIIGLFVYGLDTLLVLVCKDWMAVAIHTWALYGMAQGLIACMTAKAPVKSVEEPTT